MTMRTDLRIGIVGHADHGKTTAMAIEAFKEHGVLAVEKAPSPFDPEPIPYTNPYKDLPDLIYNPVEKKRNTNFTPPKKKRKRK